MAMSRVREQLLPSEREKKLRGTIKKLLRAEGYGFITHSATGEDYFFHRSQVKDDRVTFEQLEEDQEVYFVPSEGPKGARAVDVTTV